MTDTTQTKDADSEDSCTNVRHPWIELALREARAGAMEGGYPIGAVLIGPNGELLGKGRNRILQFGDITAHAEVQAFQDAYRRDDYSDCTLVTTAEPCWYCAGLIRQFSIPRLVVGASTKIGTNEWLESCGIAVCVLNEPESEEYLLAL